MGDNNFFPSRRKVIFECLPFWVMSFVILSGKIPRKNSLLRLFVSSYLSINSKEKNSQQENNSSKRKNLQGFLIIKRVSSDDEILLDHFLWMQTFFLPRGFFNFNKKILYLKRSVFKDCFDIFWKVNRKISSKNSIEKRNIPNSCFVISLSENSALWTWNFEKNIHFKVYFRVTNTTGKRQS